MPMLDAKTARCKSHLNICVHLQDPDYRRYELSIHVLILFLPFLLFVNTLRRPLLSISEGKGALEGCP